MEPIRRHKQYKNRAPQDTIATIQGILHEKLGIGVYERAFQERNGLFHSCRIILDDGDRLRSVNVGTNGKGMTEDYSRASAYGELMERLQNFNVLMRYQYFGTRHFLEKHREQYPQFYETVMKAYAALPYLYAYDEEVDANNERLKDAIAKLIYSADNEQLFALTKDKEHFYVPYYDVKENKIVSLPFDLIYNSISTNGLCAGNTPKEALIEGLSEIFERYVIRKIYFDNLSLPRIPRACFEGNDILKRLEELERKEHYSIDIIDCSLGVGIPAIGVVILTEDQTQYQFHMGVDPSPITALERSLTELFQGRTAIKFKAFDFELQSTLDDDIALKEDEMHKTNSASTGHYPLAFFDETPSYTFNGFDERLGRSDDEDLKLMTGLIDKMGFKLYVRDYSTLGFPAYSLYVPGMTEIHNTHSLRYFEATYEQAQQEPDEWFQEMFVDTNDVSKLDTTNMEAFDKAMLLVKQGQKKKAIRLLRQEPAMCINDMNHDFAYYLETGHGEYSWDYQCWLDDLEKGKYFKTKCFHCERCPWRQACNFVKYLQVAKRLKACCSADKIDQMRLQNIFQ